MKIRTDFVTNSSSSSFTLMIKFDLTGGQSMQFNAQGGSGETGRIDYFDGDAIVTVSPKQLGSAKNISELIKLLKNGVVDGENGKKVFNKSRPKKSNAYAELFDELDVDLDELDIEFPIFNAYEFIEEIRDTITDIDQIEKITISGNEENYVSYNRTYTYNLKTKEYTGREVGCEFEKDGSSGGDLQFTDLDSCDIEYIEAE